MDNIARTGIKPMTLELGGKSPQLVFADADLDACRRLHRPQHPLQRRPGLRRRHAASSSRRASPTPLAEALAGAWPRSAPARPGTRRRDIRRSSRSARSPASTRIVDAAVAARRRSACTAADGIDRPGYFYAPTLLAGVERRPRRP